jgi:hypothetical protein
MNHTSREFCHNHTASPLLMLPEDGIAKLVDHRSSGHSTNTEQLHRRHDVQSSECLHREYLLSLPLILSESSHCQPSYL